MKSITTTLFFVLITFCSYAQIELTQTVKGIVLDKESQSPLIGVNVFLLDSATGTTTDVDGSYRIEKVALGRQTIQFSYIGYETVTIPNILVNSAKEYVLEIEMVEDLNELSEVVVTAASGNQSASNDMATLSARSITMEEVNRFSGTFGDVARMAQNYAGVSGASDERNDIIVRGNSPSSVLWRLEGVDIPSPNHWSTLGSTGGPISMLNTNNLRNSDFFSSAFPAEYGNATGAVFDLKLRNGNVDKYEFLGQIAFNGFEAGIEGPLNIGQKASFMANYRYSTLGVINAIGFDIGTGAAVPQYQDLTFKINIPTEKAGRFSFWGLGGISDIQFLANSDGNNLFSEDDENLRSAATTGMLGMSHVYFFDENTSSNFRMSYTATESITEIEEILEEISQSFEDTFLSNQQQRKFGINWTLNKKLNAKNRVKTGFIFDNYDIQVRDSILLNNNEWFVNSDFEGTTALYQAFAQWQHKFNSKLTLNAGLHAVYFGLNDSKGLEPRLGLSYKAMPKHQFGLAYGRHSQVQPLPIYFNKDKEATPEENLMNEQLDFIRSDHFVASWDMFITSTIHTKVEAYYQSLFDLAVDPNDGDFSMINFGANFGFPDRVGLVNEGVGSNVGLEFTLEQSLNKGFYYLATASIFDSKYEGTDGIERNTFFNSNYVLNLLAGKEWMLNENFALTLDARFTYAGGRRYTPIDLDASIDAGREIRDQDQIFEDQYKPYIRPDIKIGFRHNAKKFTQTFSVDLQNFINRQNEFEKFYNATRESIRTTFQRGFFPDVRYQILF